MNARIIPLHFLQRKRHAKIGKLAFRLPKTGNYIVKKCVPNTGKKAPDFERLFARRENFSSTVRLISQVVRYLTHVQGNLWLYPRTIMEHPVHCSARHPRNNGNLLDGNGHRLLPLFNKQAKRQRAVLP